MKIISCAQALQLPEIKVSPKTFSLDRFRHILLPDRCLRSVQAAPAEGQEDRGGGGEGEGQEQPQGGDRERRRGGGGGGGAGAGRGGGEAEGGLPRRGRGLNV